MQPGHVSNPYPHGIRITECLHLFAVLAAEYRHFEAKIRRLRDDDLGDFVMAFLVRFRRAIA